jgi:cell division protein FtsB
MNIWVFLYRFAWSVLGLLLLFGLAAAFYPKVRQYHELQARHEKMEEEVRLEEELVKHLRDKQERLLSDPRFVEKIAREELGLAKPGETVFKFSDDPATTNRSSGGQR